LPILNAGYIQRKTKVLERRGLSLSLGVRTCMANDEHVHYYTQGGCLERCVTRNPDICLDLAGGISSGGPQRGEFSGRASSAAKALRGEPQRDVLSMADLRWANLTGENLRGAYSEGEPQRGAPHGEAEPQARRTSPRRKSAGRPHQRELSGADLGKENLSWADLARRTSARRPLEGGP